VPSLVILVSAVLVLSCRETESHTEADDRYTHATTAEVTTMEYLVVMLTCSVMFSSPSTVQLNIYGLHSKHMLTFRSFIVYLYYIVCLSARLSFCL